MYRGTITAKPQMLFRARRRQLGGRQHRVRLMGLTYAVRRGRRAGHVRESGCRGTWENPQVSTSVSEGRGLRHRRQYRRGAGKWRLSAASRIAAVRGNARASDRERSGMGSGRGTSITAGRQPASSMSGRMCVAARLWPRPAGAAGCGSASRRVASQNRGEGFDERLCFRRENGELFATHNSCPDGCRDLLVRL